MATEQLVGAIKSETVKSAIAAKLISSFTSPTIYKEKVLGGIIKPCFFILTVDLEQKQLMRNNYNRTYQMNVRYHPEEDDEQSYEHLTSVGTKLMTALQHIDLPMFLGNYDVVTGKPIEEVLPVKGTQINFRITDSVLLFFVT